MKRDVRHAWERVLAERNQAIDALETLARWPTVSAYNGSARPHVFARARLEAIKAGRK